MENQCLGLAERLPFSIRVFRLRLSRPWRWFAPHSLGSALKHLDAPADRLGPPWPRLLIGCGRQSIPLSRGVKHASGGRTFTVQCQDPRVRVRNFDLVIPPAHDSTKGPNVFPIVGSPNRITRHKLAEAHEHFAGVFGRLRSPRVAVLVGGASRTHGSLDQASANTLGKMLALIAPEHAIMVSTSRRTSLTSEMQLRDQLAGTDAFIWDGTGSNPYLGMLAWADAFVVTSDSVNMMCEAAGTGKPVHIFSVPGGSQKARIFQHSLTQRGITRPFEGKIESWSYVPLDETARAVEHIKGLLDLRSLPSDMQSQGP
ncbi:MAG: mitochondrial fission ELM1 family protein [Alphaproteobacteria bacterium]|nr:mitochondrial fission ELM1 family protein [Alphaproteobacteria bacterium]